MPTYELIMLMRMSHHYATMAAVKGVADSILKSGGIVRNITALGDRVLQKNIKDKEDVIHNTARYLSFQIDANPQVIHFAEKHAKAQLETLNVFVNRLSIDKSIERIYISNAIKLSPYYDLQPSQQSEIAQNVELLKQLNEKEEKIIAIKTKDRREKEKGKEVLETVNKLRKRERDMSALFNPNEHVLFNK